MIISHPTGNQNVRNAALALQKAGMLDRFFTTVAWRDSALLTRLLPTSVLRTLRRRGYESISPDRLETFPAREACRHAALILGLKALIKPEVGLCSVDAVYHDLDKRVAQELSEFPELDGVYVYEDGALETLHAAKKLGIKTNYEVASAYWRAADLIFKDEAELYPEWAPTIGALNYSEAKLRRKDEEIEMADRVFVASRFTANNLKLGNFDNKEIVIIPYGAPTPVLEVENAEPVAKNLRVLFVGSLTQGKGLSYLFEAASLLKTKITLTVIGRRIIDCLPLDRHLEQCRYIPSLPHGEVLKEMRQHDVLVFPSLWDGFGLVILEALSQGMPVIASTNTGGPDVIADGENGFIVPIRSSEAIAEKLECIANRPELLMYMKKAALDTAKKYSWARYQEMLVNNVAH